jgi:CheY-like chemotaxis protein
MTMILVVEDEIAIAEMIEMLLIDEGYGVALAANGRDAVAQLDHIRPDLVISDVMMPAMDGIALCQTLADHPVYHDVPIVLMSAGRVVSRTVCNYAAFLAKPFGVERLLATVRTCVQP